LTRKKPQDWTTKEAIRKLFPKRLADALEETVTDVDDPTPDTPKPPEKKPTT
jgi:hypothetical protein